ncbi:hypothetical protein CDD81_6223 [Ophiocordyceps australis]|uniref:Ig-like domain-containing protein n=1 Tax=Ophiocordyceps australis TaxID=1399860 RepID=A0A2C5Y7E2_9HYPO|nr:hypothetical protein CDD81_6223 [Ophiocordyceps australis]
MALLSLLVAAAALLPSQALGIDPPNSFREKTHAEIFPHDLVVPIEGYTLDIPSWFVRVHPNAPEVLLNGTIQEVERQAIALNPNWKQDISNSPTSGHLDKRAFFRREKLQCRETTRKEWTEAKVSAILKGIDHLRGTPCRPARPATGKTCERVSCSENSAIWWCNDSGQQKFLDTYGEIADGAIYILAHCRIIEIGRIAYVIGQAFHEDNWNVIVRDAWC